MIEQLIETAKLMSQAGLVRGTSGNVSCRLDGGRIAITPSALPYETLVAEDISMIDLSTGHRLVGQPASTELPLHRAVYQRRPDAQAIVHTHSTYATVLAILGRPLPPVHYLLALVGDHVPLAPYARYGSDELAQGTADALGGGGAVLMQNHGVLAVGASLAQALQRADITEQVAELYVRALSVGAPCELSVNQMRDVAQAIAGYGQDQGGRPT